jgi:hypothetical protein
MTSTVTSRHRGVTRGEHKGGRGHGLVLGVAMVALYAPCMPHSRQNLGTTRSA